MSLSSLRHKIALFHCLESADFQLLEKRLVRRRYPGGQVHFHMGDEGGSFHIIVRVRVKVTIPSSSGEELILVILATGDLLQSYPSSTESARPPFRPWKDRDLCHREDLAALMRNRSASSKA
jgi:CRP-like cAMP-binding protein